MRRSPILIIGIAGRVGSGASFVAEQLRHTLCSYKYNVECVDISFLLLLMDHLGQSDRPTLQPSEKIRDSIKRQFESRYPEAAQRTEKLQELGNDLRGRFGASILARIATSELISLMFEGDQEGRCAFIIDSLKHPEEVNFLRDTFRNAFYLIGVVCSDEKRFERLRERKAYNSNDFERISITDAAQPLKHGQKARDTILLSDYIIRNEYTTKDEIGSETRRFIGLVFGSTVTSPRIDEFAMAVANKAAGRSACLSRQVGAAILDAHGQVIATGCNDVPRFRGGLYCDSANGDMRCWARGGKCYNDHQKTQIAAELQQRLLDGGVLKKDDGDEINDKVLNIVAASRLRQIIEFSRAVHAEMDAIIAIARSGTPGLAGGTLFCTTYPCHDCAKHIIDAGIVRVVYLEPYPKSLAVELHSDAIDDSSIPQGDDKVRFEAYGGVMPSRYDDFFQAARARKSEGMYEDYDKQRQSLLPIDAPLADDLWARLQRIKTTLDQLVFNRKGETGQ